VLARDGCKNRIRISSSSWIRAFGMIVKWDIEKNNFILRNVVSSLTTVGTDSRASTWDRNNPSINR
jgi:hypothetical protein